MVAGQSTRTGEVSALTESVTEQLAMSLPPAQASEAAAAGSGAPVAGFAANDDVPIAGFPEHEHYDAGPPPIDRPPRSRRPRFKPPRRMLRAQSPALALRI